MTLIQLKVPAATASAAKAIASLTPYTSSTVQPIGAVYERVARSLAGIDDHEDREALVASRAAAAERASRAEESAEQARIFAAKVADGTVDELSYYELLQIERTASDDEISEAYQKLLTVYHPDKQAGAAAALATETGKANKSSAGSENDLFLKVTKAKDILLDTKLRRDYDSTLPFDDGFPEDGEGEGDAYFAAWRPVFERNAMWSNKHPVPSLGDEKTPVKDVERFFKFWFSFDSWREFPEVDLSSAADAGSRYERRETEQKNKKLRAARKKLENQRLISLVERAYAVDPRLVAARNAAQAAKDKIKNEKLAKEKAIQDAKDAEERAIKEKEEAEAKAAADAAAAKKNAAAAKKAEKEKLRKEKQKARKRLREASAAKGVDAVIVEELCAALETVQLEELSTKVEAAADEGAATAACQAAQ